MLNKIPQQVEKEVLMKGGETTMYPMYLLSVFDFAFVGSIIPNVVLIVQLN